MSQVARGLEVPEIGVEDKGNTFIQRQLGGLSQTPIRLTDIAIRVTGTLMGSRKLTQHLDESGEAVGWDAGESACWEAEGVREPYEIGE